MALSNFGRGTTVTGVIRDKYGTSTSPTVRDYTVQGRVPSGQTGETASSYKDTVTITLDY